MKIVFGIMSAVAKQGTVEQLARSLAPHTVAIHHDFSQNPAFDIRLPNTHFVPDPRRTAYASFAWTLGALHLLRHCVDTLDFDYFQLMSPACLPIKPLSAFEDYLSRGQADCHVEILDVGNRPDAMMTFGHRVFAPDHSVGRALLRRARAMYYRDSPIQQETAGLAIWQRPESSAQSRQWMAKAGVAVTSLAKAGMFGVRVPEAGMRLYMGGAWFGVSRKAAEYLVRKAVDPKIQEFFRNINDVGETMFPTLIGNSGFRLGPFNHYVTPYNGPHPRWLGVDDLDTLAGTPAFFARKFPDDPEAEVRKRVLERVMPMTAETDAVRKDTDSLAA